MSEFQAYTGKEPYIYLNYDPKDHFRVKIIIEEFQKYRHVRLWFANEYTTFEQRAEKIKSCAAFLSCITNTSIQSEIFKQEINLAIELRKNPMIVYLEDVTLSLGMRMRLGTLQAIYAQRHDGIRSLVDELCRAESIAPCQEGYRPGPKTADTMTAEECGKKGWEMEEIGEIEEAIEWWKKAIEKGETGWAYRIGQTYASGDRYGIGTDYKEAFKWHMLAAKNGHYMSQCELGYYYYEGTGVEKDLNEAIRWWKLSAQKNFEPSTRMLDQLGVKY